MDQKDLKILEHLRGNARETLTMISKETGIPISSTYDRMKRLEGIGVIKKYTCLLELEKIGICTQVVILLKTRNTMQKNLECWLNANEHANNLMRMNGEWDFLTEVVVKDIKTLEDFIESLREDFGKIRLSVLYVLEDLKREGFLNRETVQRGDENRNGCIC